MKIKLHNFAFYRKKRHLGFFLSVLAFSCVSASFGLAPNTSADLKVTTSYLQQQITGTITDVNGQPIPGVNVVEKGTGNGAQSDFDGGFFITPSKANTVLIFSFVGFKTKEVTVTNQNNLKITLEEDISALDEVVVVGYGTRTKTTVTSAVAQIDSETFENRAIASVSNGLQGAVPGLQITNSSSGGEPGASQNINIRGLMTSTGSGVTNAGPLVLVDGAVMDMNDINPEDIETLTVLKDAAAASIYGSRAAGGAILIVTKSGKNMDGGMKVNYSNNFSFSSPTAWPQQPDAVTYANVMNEGQFNMNGARYHHYSEEAIGWI